MIDGFVKNSELLKENSKVKDLLDFDNICKKFSKKLDSLSGRSIIALVGPFGSGKSTMLHQIMISRLEKEFWFEFDAWKYPDRKDLWEGFVLDLIRNINPKNLKKVEKEIKGTQNEFIKTLVNFFSKILGFSVLESVNHFFDTSPAKRVDDIQKILKNQIACLKKDLYITVEDIDRSGDAGIFFLETINQFIRTSGLSNKIVFIVPMANENYHKNIASYLKCIDYFEFFEQGKIKLDRFVDVIFDNELFSGNLYNNINGNLIWTGSHRRTQTISFFEGLFQKFPEMSIRLLKLIIRKANLVYKNQVDDGHNPDFRVTLCIEASKYFKTIQDTKKNYFDSFKETGVILQGSIFCSYMFAILTNFQSIYSKKINERGEEKYNLRESPYYFVFINRIDNNLNNYPSYPWTFKNSNDINQGSLGGITNFYLNY